MTQQIIDTGLVANDGTGESLRNAFTAVNNNFANVWAAGPVDTQVIIYSNVVSTNVTNLDLRLAGNGIGTITVESTVVPSIDRVYDLGTPTKQYDSVYAQYYFGNGAFLTGISGGNGSASNSFSTISANGVNIVATSATDTLTLTSGNNVVILGNSGTDTVVISLVNNPVFSGNITAGGNIIGSNVNAINLSLSGNVLSGLTVAGNVTAPYFVGNGSQLTGVVTSLGGNLAANINTGIYNLFSSNGAVKVDDTLSVTGTVITTGGILSGGPFTTTANVTANYFIGDGSQLTNLPAGNYSNTNVAAFLPTYTGNVTAGNISSTGNIQGSYLLGNGSQLTGISSSLSGNLSGNINTGIYNLFSSNGAVKVDDALSVTGTVTATGGLITPGPVATTANVTANYFVGDGSQLTNLPAGNYSNANVEAYLPTYTGNVAANNFIGNGAALTSIVGANIVGLVANAIYALNANSAAFATTAGQATYATVANSVAGANVTGTVANAAYALNSNSSSFSNQANIANVANSVAGANVTGTVANATYALISNAATYATIAVNSAQSNYANIANTVNGANVVGIVANAAYAVIASSADTANTAGLAQYVTANAQANITSVGVLTSLSATGNITGNFVIGNGSQLTGVVKSIAGNLAGNINTLEFSINSSDGEVRFGNSISVIGNAIVTNDLIVGDQIATTGNITTAANVYAQNFIGNVYGNVFANILVPGANTDVLFNSNGEANATSGLTFNKVSNVLTVGGNVSAVGNVSGNYILGNGSQLTGLPELYGNANVAAFLPTYTGNLTAGNVSVVGNVTANAFLGNTASIVGNITTSANVIASYFVGNFAGNISGNLTVPGANTQVIFNTNGSADATSGFTFDKATNAVSMGGNATAVGNITASYFIGNGSQLTGIDATIIQNGNSNVKVYANANVATSVNGVSNVLVLADTGAYVTGIVSATGNINTIGSLAADTITSYAANANVSLVPNGTGLVTIDDSNGGSTGIQLGTPTAGALVSNAVTLTTSTSVTNGIAQLNLILGKLVPPSPPNFPNATTIALSGIATYRMANIVQVDNTPGANRAVAAGTAVANVLRVATYATNTISTVGPGDLGIVTAVRNGANVGNVTLNTDASPTANGTYGGNLVITNNYDYHVANASIAAGFWYVFSAAVSGTSALAGWNELYIADSVTGNTNTTVWYYDNSSPSTPSFSSTTMAPPGSANLLYSSTIPHYTNNNNFTIGFNVANVSGNTYPTSNTLASGSAGGAFAAPASINYNASNIGSNTLSSFASASANTTSSITTGFGGSSTGPSMSVNNSYSTGTLTLTAALGNTVLWKSGTATAIDEGNVVIESTIGTGSGNAFRIVNPGSGNTPAYTSNVSAFNSQSSTLTTYDSTVVGAGSAGVLKHDQTNYSTGYLPAGPNLSAGRSGTQYFTFKFVRTAVSKFDIRYTGTIAGMWVALPGSVIDSSSGANGWIDMSVAYGGAGYPGVTAPGNGSDGCALAGTVILNSAVTNSSKTCTFGTVSSSSTATNEIYVRISLTSGQSVTALTLQTASN